MTCQGHNIPMKTDKKALMLGLTAPAQIGLYESRECSIIFPIIILRVSYDFLVIFLWVGGGAPPTQHLVSASGSPDARLFNTKPI